MDHLAVSNLHVQLTEQGYGGSLQELQALLDDAHDATQERLALARCSGKRRRHAFVSPGAPALWQKIHADLNGAFNILRKACLKFKWHPGLTPWYELLWLSPKKGLKAMRQTTARSAGIARAPPV